MKEPLRSVFEGGVVIVGEDLHLAADDAVPGSSLEVGGHSAPQVAFGALSSSDE